MIKNLIPLSIPEAEEIFEKSKTEKDLRPYFKKYGQLKISEAKKLKSELESLEILKLKKELISKIIDFMPRDLDDLNKIFVDVSLEKNESDKILDIVKKYK